MKQICEEFFDENDIKDFARSLKFNPNAIYICSNIDNKKTLVYFMTSNGLTYFVEVLEIAKIIDNKPLFSVDSFDKLKSKLRECARDILTLLA